jgi:hypothetical protein
MKGSANSKIRITSKKEFEVCAYIKGDQNIIHTNFIPIQGVLLLCCACNSGCAVWACSQMEESVAPHLKSGRRTTHQFALRPGCLFIYVSINDGASRMDRWRLAFRLGVESTFMF